MKDGQSQDSQHKQEKQRPITFSSWERGDLVGEGLGGVGRHSIEGSTDEGRRKHLRQHGLLSKHHNRYD
jgi:hypothetical protein